MVMYVASFDCMEIDVKVIIGNLPKYSKSLS